MFKQDFLTCILLYGLDFHVDTALYNRADRYGVSVLSDGGQGGVYRYLSRMLRILVVRSRSSCSIPSPLGR